jgi:hypothetical protein
MRSQIQEYVMGIWFNGFQTKLALYVIQKLSANTILALYMHVARKEECYGRIYYLKKNRWH